MAAKKEEPKKDAAAPAADAPAKPKKKFPKTVVIIAVVSLVEGAGFFAATKMMGGGPQVAHGEETGDDHLKGEAPTHEKGTVEIELLSKQRIPNDRKGRLYIYDFDLVVKVELSAQESVEKLIAERKSELSDRIARIVRGSEATVLEEPDLKTLRMQFRHALSELLHDEEVVQEVLIPRCVPIRSD